ncbi:MAG TPA: GNAT family N-acetyltransferase [Methylomirabilota bacterium]|jgi:8-oxo-dGTP diphosphatase|nr:GNAT family N-acetyltransferase [Methylomirabilota bacterium]
MDILTQRLRLRSLAPRDAGALIAHLNDWQVARWLARPPYPYSAADAEAFIALVRERHRRPHPLLFALADRDEDRLIGTIGIEPDGACGGELGYWIGQPFWGRGFGREAATAIIGAAAAAGLEHVNAYADPLNARSVRLLQGCGFRPDGYATRPTRAAPASMRRFVLVLSPDGLRRSGAAPT